jgi:uracil-DNA glycosylase
VKAYPRKRVRAFINHLAERPPGRDTCNPYRIPALARNLELYLQSMWRDSRYRGLMLVGEALGYRGGRNTGIPFSSSQLLQQAPHSFLARLNPGLSLASQESEATAAIVWQYLATREELPLFWNAFPYHPHRRDEPDSNRKPRKAELEEGGSLLAELAAIFKPGRVAGLGREGQRVAVRVFPGTDVSYIRHPSYGGKSVFVHGLDALLD